MGEKSKTGEEFERQALRRLMEFMQVLLPPGWRWESRPPRRFDTFEYDATLEMGPPEASPFVFFVEMKHSVEPKVARRLAERATQLTFTDSKWLVAAPALSERSRSILQGAGVSWVDLRGDCFLHHGTLLIDRRGAVHTPPLETTRTRLVADLFHGGALDVVRWLLAFRSHSWTIAEMAERTKRSIPFVGRVFQTLEASAYVSRSRGSTRLTDAEGLLDAWAKAPPPVLMETQAVFLAGAQALLKKLQEPGLTWEHALTAEAAADFFAPYARYNRLELYVSSPDVWLDRYSMKVVPRGGNVVLLHSAEASLYETVHRRGGLHLASPPQIYVDLKRRQGPAQEAADVLKRSGHLWNEPTPEETPGL